MQILEKMIERIKLQQEITNFVGLARLRPEDEIEIEQNKQR